MTDPTKPGRQKTGGRRKGTLNKRTAIQRLLKVDEALLKQGLDPIAEVLRLLPKLDPKDQVKVLLELTSYLQVKPRVEAPVSTPPQDPAAEIPTAQLLSLVKHDPK